MIFIFSTLIFTEINFERISRNKTEHSFKRSFSNIPFFWYLRSLSLACHTTREPVCPFWNSELWNVGNKLCFLYFWTEDGGEETAYINM